MINEINISNYTIIEKDKNIFVELPASPELSGSGKPRINITNLDIEVIGIRQKEKFWAVTIITNPAIQKTIHGLNKHLKVLDFEFDNLPEAITMQNFLLMALHKETIGDTNANG